MVLTCEGKTNGVEKGMGRREVEDKEQGGDVVEVFQWH